MKLLIQSKSLKIFYTIVPLDKIQEQYQSIYNDISVNLINQYDFFDSRDLIIEPSTNLHPFISFSNIYISSSKTKRNVPANFLFNVDNYFISNLYIDIFAHIIPFNNILDQNNSSSFVYSILRIPESERAIQTFFLYFFSQLLNFDSEVNAAVFHQLLLFLELSDIDLLIYLTPEIDRESSIRLLRNKTGCSEIQAELLLEQLLHYPGSYYLSFIVLESLYNHFTIIQSQPDPKEKIKELFTLIQNFYGAPIKLLLEKLETLK